MICLFIFLFSILVVFSNHKSLVKSGGESLASARPPLMGTVGPDCEVL